MIVQNHCIILQHTNGYWSSGRREQMDSLSPQPGASEAQRAQANKLELVERIARAIRDDGRVEPLNGLYLNRVSSPTEPGHGMSTPAFCVIAQGSKDVFLADNRYRYDPMHYLLATVGLKCSTLSLLNGSLITSS